MIDWGDPENNNFQLVSQFWISGDLHTRRTDLIGFVNGLPLAVLELKSPVDANATLERAHTQLRNYQAKAPELLRTNQVLVISDGIQARIGSLTTGLDRFAPWRTIDGTALDDEGRPELAPTLEGRP